MRDGDLIFVCGKKRSGKTSLAVRACVRDITAGRNGLAYDPTGDVTERLLGNSASGAKLAKDRVVKVTSAALAREVFKRSPWSVFEAFATPKAQPGRVAVFRESAPFVEAASASWSDGFVHLVDECEELFPNVTTLPPKVNGLFRKCGNRGTRVYAISQRPQSVSASLRANTDYVAAFRTDQDLVLTALEQCGADFEVWEPCKTLAQHHCLVRPPWRESSDTPLARIDARSAPIPWKVYSS